MLLQFSEEFPARWAIVALQYRAAMHGDRCRAYIVRGVENLEEPLAALGRVVDSTAHLDRHRDVRRHGVSYSANDLERDGRLAQMESTATAAQDFFHGATEIDIDDVKAMLDEP